MECEMCGAREARKKVKIEGVVLFVCDECARFGSYVGDVEKKKERKKVKKDFKLIEDYEEVVVEDIGKRVKELRERLGLTQEELASKIKERVSVVKRVEEGWIPPMDVVRKLEKFFSTKLTERVRVRVEGEKEEEERLTIADVAEIRVR
jgi:putative transcription factor